VEQLTGRELRLRPREDSDGRSSLAAPGLAITSMLFEWGRQRSMDG
jgi:hypothetical protein